MHQFRRDRFDWPTNHGPPVIGAPAMTFSAGERLGTYEIVGSLGAGRMGEVYGVPPSDPRSLAAAAIFAVLVAAIAIAIPVARATHIEPAAALRTSSREGISNPWATESKAPSVSVRTYKAILTPTLHARAISVVPTTARIYPSYTRSTQFR
jgi:hypothetical protein